MTAQIQQLTPELTLERINEIPVLTLNHSVGSARIALQGAQLLNWQPKGAEQDIFWLSEIEPFTQGVAIRGGMPICYPWFGGVKQPSHGTARLRLWQLSDYDLQANKVRLEFSLFSEYGVIEAKMKMKFTDKCTMTLTHLGQDLKQHYTVILILVIFHKLKSKIYQAVVMTHYKGSIQTFLRLEE